jgi:hypothetical protein
LEILSRASDSELLSSSTLLERADCPSAAVPENGLCLYLSRLRRFADVYLYLARTLTADTIAYILAYLRSCYLRSAGPC